MSKEEAIQAMKEGKKVTHRFFSSDEWMTIENGFLLLSCLLLFFRQRFLHRINQHCRNKFQYSRFPAKKQQGKKV